MRFQFCGNISCPQWFIAQISTLTKITAVKMKLVFSQLITHLMEGTDVSVKTLKLLNGTGLDSYEMNGVVATLNFILQNSIMFQVSDQILNKELVDLGLPKQNVQSITKTYKTSRDKLIQLTQERVLKTSSEIQLTYSIQEFVGSSELGQTFIDQQSKNIRYADCQLTYKNVDEEKSKLNFIFCPDQLDEMIFQLEDALTIMKKIQKKAQ